MRKGSTRWFSFAAAMATLVGSSSAAHAAVLAYYSFNDSTNLGKDSSGNAYDLAAPASGSTPAAVTAGRVGGAAKFDGVDDILARAGFSSTAYAARPAFSVSFWAKPNAVGGTGTTQTLSRPSSNDGLALLITNGNYRGSFSAATPTLIDSGTAAVAGAYSNVVISYTSTGGSGGPGTASIYVDGTLKATNAVTLVTPAGTSNFAVGGRASPGTAAFFAGELDEFAIYDQALTATQAASLADGTATPLTVVPEPATLGALVAGSLTLVGRRRRR